MKFNNYMTGIKTTGTPHIANILSVINPTILYINKYKKKKFFILIADLHSITNYNNKNILINNIYNTISVWLSFLNFNFKKNNIYFYRQSDIKEITELFWYLNCFFPFNRLKLSHVFKNNKNNNINTGIINYPILMASDILLYDINYVIIGKDQIQHIEFTRKIAKIINSKINSNLFKLPNYKIIYNKIIPGIDGNKMSKSNNNIINIFENKTILENQIMNIKTNNKFISYNNFKSTILYKLYKIITNKEEIIYLKEKIKNNKIGYYNIKKKLYNYILKFYSKERKKFNYYINNINIIKKILYINYKKIKYISKKKIYNIKNKLGLKI
ncbi:MAG: hypothetical protein RDO_0820 [Flavobacteriales endosymbiont of Rhyzopertha dominica]|nr:MAG: tryptophan--tRNA ligase [Candidatus Shikimatogenerans bostrichidophilus]